MLITGCWAGFLAGCAGAPPRPAVQPPVPGYLGAGPALQGLDITPLRGRHVLLDPGHGGRFRGAVGPGGLTEADVNLGVALHLRGLLEWAGARVSMTRTADTDLSTAADSTLAGDLERRVALAEALRPDAFVSLHHNSNAALDRALNETQTYYRLGDDGASLDLARAVHRQLALQLGIRPARLLPGNFRVLRQDAAPTVLGEPAMLSHPVMEERLRRPEAQRREAEAYFLGLLEYFRGGRPAWLPAEGDTLWFAAGERPSASWRLRTADADSGHAAGPEPDPLTFNVSLDGRTQAFAVDPDGVTVRWRASLPLAAHLHALEINGANLEGRRAPGRRAWLLPAPAREIELTLSRDGDGRTAVAWAAPDGHPLGGGSLRWADGTTITVGTAPRGWSLLPGLPAGAPVFTPRMATSGVPAARVTRADLPEPWRWRQPADAPAASPRWRLPTAPPALPVAFSDGAPLLAVNPGAPLWCEWPGLLPLVDPAPLEPALPRTVEAGAWRWPTHPLAPSLQGRVVVLDPAGGGDDPDGAGPLGLRGSDVNLATARDAAALLRGAGAVVHLTRAAEEALTPSAKVALADAVGAHIFLTIGRAAAPGVVGARHHVGSRAGAALAAGLARACATLPADSQSTAISEGTEYLLRQTRCPAVTLTMPAIATAEREHVLGQAAWTAAEARAVLLGLATAMHGPAAAATGPAAAAFDPAAAAFDPAAAAFEPAAALALIAAQPDGAPLAAFTAVIVDGQFPWRPCPRLPGLAGAGASPSLTSGTGPGLPPGDGRHVLEVRTTGTWQLWLIEPGRDGMVAERMAGGARGSGAADEATAGAGH
jgi:N-acetylmuramoyl-L-alanine amidase